MFYRSSNVQINNGKFTSINVEKNSQELVLLATQKRLYSRILPEALYDHKTRHFEPRTHKKAENASTNTIKWIHSNNDNTPQVLVINSNSAKHNSWIAHKVSTICRKEKCLGAAFFCRPVEESNETSWSRKVEENFFLTIAYQLVAYHPNDPASDKIKNLVKRDPAIVERCLGTQLRDLIIKPLKNAKKPLTIVIDGLDTVSGVPSEELKQHILQMLIRIPRRRVRFIITGQPTTYQWIKDGFRKRNLPFDEIRIPLPYEPEHPNNNTSTRTARSCDFGMLAKLAMDLAQGAISCLYPHPYGQWPLQASDMHWKFGNGLHLKK